MEKTPDAKNLLVVQLEWLLDAESLQLTEFPDLAMKISNDTFRGIIEKHIKESDKKITKLEQAFYLLHTAIRRRPCNAMDALLDEVRELMDYGFAKEVLDAGALCCFQKIKVYQIAAYSAARSYATTLQEPRVANLMHENLEVERLVEHTLSRLAEATINMQADLPREEISIW